MSAISSAQLAALELQVCNLVHPDWLPLTVGEMNNINSSCPQSYGFDVVLSRHLIDTHRLTPLAPNMFAHDWMYSVLGGHTAMQALVQQIATYLIATWVQSTISGEQARELRRQFGHDVYDHSLRAVEPLRTWRAPNALLPNTVEHAAKYAQTLVDGLWCFQAPQLVEWASLMSSPPTRAHLKYSGGMSLADDVASRVPPGSDELLEEITRRLQVDFAIDVEAIFSSCVRMDAQ